MRRFLNVYVDSILNTLNINSLKTCLLLDIIIIKIKNVKINSNTLIKKNKNKFINLELSKSI